MSDYVLRNGSARKRAVLALEPVRDAPTVFLTRDLCNHVIECSRDSERRRMIQPFHRSAEEPLHRMLNAVQPDSYVRPHRHLAPPKHEAFIVLRGALAFFTFDDEGSVVTATTLGPTQGAFGVDVQPGVFHTLVAREPDTLLYEVKTGPYVVCVR